MISNIETAHSIFNLAFLLQKKLMRPVIGKSGEHLSPLQVHVLDALQHRTPATMTSLANEVWMTKQQLTGIVTKLVKRGIAQRDFDPDDRRVVRISLTTKGGGIAGPDQKRDP